MKHTGLLTSLILTGIVSAFSQPESEFHWIEIASCAEKDGMPVYRTVELSPALTGTTEPGLLVRLNDILSDTALNGNIGQALRLKVWFLPDGSVCLRAIGTKPGELTQNQTVRLSGLFAGFRCRPGRQREIVRNCEGLITLFFTGDAIATHRFSGFSCEAKAQ